MTYEVRVTRRARADLERLAEWIEDRAGVATANAYVARVEARIATLGDFPNRGSPRQRFGADVRTLSFERRLLIYYRVVGDDVVRVVRIIAAASDVQSLI